MIVLDFVIRGYPGSGRRVEDEGELASVYGPDLVQGAFMGDAVMEMNGADFTTSFGWLTLLDWCLRLHFAMRALESSNSTSIEFSESDDFLRLDCLSDRVGIAASYSSSTAEVNRAELSVAIDRFIDRMMDWVACEFPSALQNPAMPDVYERLGRQMPPLVGEA